MSPVELALTRQARKALADAPDKRQSTSQLLTQLRATPSNAAYLRRIGSAATG